MPTADVNVASPSHSEQYRRDKTGNQLHRYLKKRKTKAFWSWTCIIYSGGGGLSSLCPPHRG
ncbi:uncharacterized protein G2W53_042604 [Senna tora]|uniref:Uncharacterized protein n=1 Tax=Senna tora TaxID=362788 RepID=A0A834VZ42_9FABA|nr:uncharacterized protein G2W53_042604 [Senna tora]